MFIDVYIVFTDRCFTTDRVQFMSTMYLLSTLYMLLCIMVFVLWYLLFVMAQFDKMFWISHLSTLLYCCVLTSQSTDQPVCHVWSSYVYLFLTYDPQSFQSALSTITMYYLWTLCMHRTIWPMCMGKICPHI